MGLFHVATYQLILMDLFSCLTLVCLLVYLQTEFVESCVLFKANKTSEWLLDQTDQDRSSRIAQARTQGRQLQMEDTEKRERLNQAHRERLQMLREAGQKKDDKERDRYEACLETVVQSGGLWEASDIDAHTNAVSMTRAKKLLAAQINVRVKVLQTVLENKIALSKASVAELSSYLLELIETGVPYDRLDLVDILQNPASIVGLDIAQKWAVKDGVEAEWCAGTIRDFVTASNEYRVAYSSDESECFMQVDELVTDIVMGNLDIHYV